MAAWEVTAAGLLGALAGAIPGLTGQGIPLLPAIIDPFEPTGLSVFAGGGGRARPRSRAFVAGTLDPATGELIKHRHRRKRALTNGDRADIAFIAATVSKAAAGTFAAQLAARSR